MKRGKKYRETIKKYQAESGKDLRTQKFALVEACQLVKDLSFAKFDESIDLSVKVHLKKSQSVRDTVVLPHQFRAEKKILVFCKPEKEQEARDAGAAFVGADDMIAKVKDGWLDFDIAVATPDMMKDVGKLGMILGRKGLMPNPKTGTVTFDLKTALSELKKGRVEFRADKTGVIHLTVGKASMDTALIAENVHAVLGEVSRKKPVDTKGQFILSVSVSSTMGPGVWVSNTEEV
jgi:large subunit ribosomal protein L1